MRNVRDLLVVTALIGCGAAAMLGCGTSSMPDASSSPPECTAITERCHPVDPGTGPIHDCHELAESSSATASSCLAMQSMCFAVCVPADAGSDASGGSDAGGG